MAHIMFIHSSVSGHSGCSHLLAHVSHALMDMGVQRSQGRQSLAFSSFKDRPRSGVAVSYGHSVFDFSEELPTNPTVATPVSIPTGNAQS